MAGSFVGVGHASKNLGCVVGQASGRLGGRHGRLGLFPGHARDRGHQRRVAPGGRSQGQRIDRRIGRRRLAARRASPPRGPSSAQKLGLRGTEDALDLKSSAALVIDQDTDEVLFSKNAEAVLPIASITKLMTAIVVLDAGQPMDEPLQGLQGRAGHAERTIARACRSAPR